MKSSFRNDFVLLTFTCYLLTAGCAGLNQQAPSQEVRAFFVAGKEADFSGFQKLSPKCLDLSGYTQFMGIKYPPTQTVDVLAVPPTRPYQTFAVLESPDSSGSPGEETVEKLKDKAKEIGADAIILACASGAPRFSHMLPAQEKTVALAIKYRKYHLDNHH